MKKKINNQGGITLVEVLLAVVILGFIVSGVVLLSGSIMKTNTSSLKQSQAMAYATNISELIKSEYTSGSSELIIEVKSTVKDKNGVDNEYSIDEKITVPIIEDKIKGLTGIKIGGVSGSMKYMSGEETGYEYEIDSELKLECRDDIESELDCREDTLPITIVTVKVKEEKIVFKHNFK